MPSTGGKPSFRQVSYASTALLGPGTPTRMYRTASDNHTGPWTTEQTRSGTCRDAELTLAAGRQHGGLLRF